jgi:hypothetical protein
VPSKRYGFSLEPPANWFAASGVDTGLPLLVNFPWSKLEAQATLPKGGATINILAEDQLAGPHQGYTLDEWAEFDERGASKSTISSRPLEILPSTGISRAIIVAFDEMTYSASEQRQHDFTVYWEFRGKRFAAHLAYVIGDPKAKQHESVLISVMRSIRPL